MHRMFRATAACLALTVPLSAFADSFRGVIGSRLLNDQHPVANGDLYIGFINGTADTLRLTREDGGSANSGFRILSMPEQIAPGSHPKEADAQSPYAVNRPWLVAAAMAYAPFPQPEQGHVRYHMLFQRDQYNRSSKWQIDPAARARYYITPEGRDAGPQSGIMLTIDSDSQIGSFDFKTAAEHLGGYVGFQAGRTAWMGLTTLRTLRQRFALKRVLAQARAAAFWKDHLMMSLRTSTVVYLLAEISVWNVLSGLDVVTLSTTSHAYVRLGEPGNHAEVENPLLQKVVSPDGRFEYTLTVVRAANSGTSDGSNVPDDNDALLVLGVARRMSATATCRDLEFDTTDGPDTLLRGTCRLTPTPSTYTERESALAMNLCAAGGDVFNDKGRLDCASRFSGPFEQQFRKFDGDLRGAYLYADDELQVYSGNQGVPVVLARLRHPEGCRPGSITYGLVTRQMKQFHTLSCTRD